MGLALQLLGFYGWGRHVESPPQITPLDMETKPESEALLELITQGSRIPLEEVKKYPHGRIFEEVDEIVQPRDPDCHIRLEVGSEPMLRELSEVRSEDHAAREADRARPYRLISRRSNSFLNSSGRSIPRLTRRRPYNPAFMHPEDLEELGLGSGSVVRIRSEHDEILAIVAPEKQIRRGVISMTHAFGESPDGTEDEVRRVGSNTGRRLRTAVPRQGA